MHDLLLHYLLLVQFVDLLLYLETSGNLRLYVAIALSLALSDACLDVCSVHYVLN